MDSDPRFHGGGGLAREHDNADGDGDSADRVPEDDEPESDGSSQSSLDTFLEHRGM